MRIRFTPTMVVLKTIILFLLSAIILKSINAEAESISSLLNKPLLPNTSSIPMPKPFDNSEVPIFEQAKVPLFGKFVTKAEWRCESYDGKGNRGFAEDSDMNIAIVASYKQCISDGSECYAPVCTNRITPKNKRA